MTEPERRPYRKGGSRCTAEGCDRKTKARDLCMAHYQRARRGTEVDGALRPPPVDGCRFEGCENPVHGRGLCQGHYWQERNKGALTGLDSRVASGGQCTVGECGRPAHAAGLCPTHYQRRAAGQLDWDRPIKTKAADGEGHLDKHGYRFIQVEGKRTAEHRHVMEQTLGRPLRDGENVHHKNKVRHDNRLENLELWLTGQPTGARVEDLVTYWVDMLGLYAPHLLADEDEARPEIEEGLRSIEEYRKIARPGESKVVLADPRTLLSRRTDA